MKVDLVRHLVKVEGHEVQLTLTEKDLLKALINSAGKVVTQNQLLRQVWGGPYDKEAHLLGVHISNLRAESGKASYEIDISCYEMPVQLVYAPD